VETHVKKVASIFNDIILLRCKKSSYRIYASTISNINKLSIQYRVVGLSWFWLSCLGPLVYLVQRLLYYFDFQPFCLSVHDVGYFRFTSCALS
jgi:hypothetical protein